MSGFIEVISALFKTFILLFDENIAKSVNVLSMDITTDAIFSGVYSTATGISNIIVKPTATSIVAICFLIEFLKLSLKMDMFKWEYAISALAKFAIAKSALDIAPDFMLAVYARGTQMIARTTVGNVSLFSSVDSIFTDVMASAGFFQAIALALAVSIIFLAVMVIGIFILVMAYARIFEIILYISVAPLPIAFIPLENSGITKKFALNFASVVLQGLIMLVILLLFNALVRNSLLDAFAEIDTGNSWEAIGRLSGTLLVATLTLVTAVMKSGSIAKSVLGQG